MKKYISIVVAAILLSSCSDSDSNSPKVINLDSDEAVTAFGENEFSYNLFNGVYGLENKNENIVISPLGIYQYLSLYANGAAGSTKSDILNVLNSNNTEILNCLNEKLYKNLPNLDNKVICNLANSIWIDNSFDVNSDYLELVDKYYHPEIKRVNLNAESAKEAINAWCSKSTNGMLQDVLSQPLSSRTVQMINATYFYGKWKDVFDKKKTEKGTFYNIDGSTSRVDMMSKTSDIELSGNNYYDVAKLTYGNGAFEMLALLPNPDKNLGDIIPQINTAEIGKLEFYTANRLLTFPKFELMYDAKGLLGQALQQLGLRFLSDNSENDFSGISSGKIDTFIPKHKCIIKVDENGTEVASVTVGGYIAPEPQELTFDRPFVYIIRENSTGIILYMGTVVKL